MENQKSDQKENSLRISIDSKAKVKIGNLSRGGKTRSRKALKADDHDNKWTHVLVPFGILDVKRNDLSIYFGQSAETSDFIMDCLKMWWSANKKQYEQIEELVIDLDGGSATRSNRSQFIKRMVEFAQENKLKVRLIYYPPYHSKYNPIERWTGRVRKSLEWNNSRLNRESGFMGINDDMERNKSGGRFSHKDLSKRSQSIGRRIRRMEKVLEPLG